MRLEQVCYLSAILLRIVVKKHARDTKGKEAQTTKRQIPTKPLQILIKSGVSPVFLVVPMEGVEPTHSHEYQILSLI